MAIFVGIGLVSKEIERRTIYTILARPITRTQFVLGKYFGLVFIGGLNIAIMFAMFLSTIWLSGNAIFGSLFQAVQLMWVEVLLVTALAMFFSTFSSPTLSAIMTLGFYVIGHLTGDLKAIGEDQEPRHRKHHDRLVLRVSQPGVAECQRAGCHRRAGERRLSSRSYRLWPALCRVIAARSLPHLRATRLLRSASDP